MTSVLPLRLSLHPVCGGCRSFQRLAHDCVSTLQLFKIEKGLSQYTERQMQHLSTLSSGITIAEYTQGDMAASWHPLPAAGSDQDEQDEQLVMMLATRDRRGRRNNGDTRTPFIFLPCRLHVSPCDAPSEQFQTPSSSFQGKLESVALPGDVVRGFLSGSLPRWRGRSVRDQLGPAHFDDEDAWVFSRCIMADFSGMSDDEAANISSQGRLGCWASVTLTQQASGRWDLGFLIHRLVVSGSP